MIADMVARIRDPPWGSQSWLQPAFSRLYEHAVNSSPASRFWLRLMLTRGADPLLVSKGAETEGVNARGF
jgi:hypothetical protein